MSKFLSTRFNALSPYVPGEIPASELLKLNTNESPFPPAPAVLDAITREKASKLNLYSDPDLRDLTRAIANRMGVQPDQVIPGNGSDDILLYCFEAFCDKEVGVCFPDISYGFYPVFAQFLGIDAKPVPLKEDFSIAPEDYFAQGRTIFIANPNAPTGLALSTAQIEQILLQNKDNVVVIDEAYVDFGAQSCVRLVDKYDNLVVVQTMSKSRSLAGARLGYAVASAELIADLQKMRFSSNPYNVNRLSSLAGAAAMSDQSQAYYETCIEHICQTRAYVTDALRERGFTVLDSSANFVFARPNRIAGPIFFEKMKARGIYLRRFNTPRIADYLRITIGSCEQMERFIAAVDQLWEELS
ncbi:MAG: histidinol-phosphate transaminase [Clostridia bacterium]|nr:histidinol-phosphate transaminase [Clostridia bacterium]